MFWGRISFPQNLIIMEKYKKKHQNVYMKYKQHRQLLFLTFYSHENVNRHMCMNDSIIKHDLKHKLD